MKGKRKLRFWAMLMAVLIFAVSVCPLDVMAKEYALEYNDSTEEIINPEELKAGDMLYPGDVVSCVYSNCKSDYLYTFINMNFLNISDRINSRSDYVSEYSEITVPSLDAVLQEWLDENDEDELTAEEKGRVAMFKGWEVDTVSVVCGYVCDFSVSPVFYTEDEIMDLSSSECKVIFDKESYQYTGSAIVPEVTVKIGDKVVDPSNYDVVADNNVNVGDGKITVTAKSMPCKGSITVYFKIVDETIDLSSSKCAVILDKAFYTYTGSPIVPTVTVKNGDTVIDPSYYDVVVENNLNAGDGRVKVSAKSFPLKGSITVSFKITKADNAITGTPAYVKTTSSKSQSFKLDTKALAGTITYKSSDSKNVSVSKDGKVTIKKGFIGKATITATVAESMNYKGTSFKTTVTVNPGKASISKLKSSSKKTMNITWKKVSGITGYEVQYSTDKKFNKSVKIKTISKASTISLKVTKLKSSKKYYVRVREYKKVGKTKFYGAWSSVKNVKIK